LADAGLAEPELPAPEDERDLLVRVHGHKLLAVEDALGRVAAGQAGEVDAQVAVGQLLGHERGEDRAVAAVVVGHLAALLDVERHRSFLPARGYQAGPPRHPRSATKPQPHGRAGRAKIALRPEVVPLSVL